MAVSIIETDVGFRIRLSQRNLAVLYITKQGKHIDWQRKIYRSPDSIISEVQMTDRKYTLGLI